MPDTPSFLETYKTMTFPSIFSRARFGSAGPIAAFLATAFFAGSSFATTFEYHCAAKADGSACRNGNHVSGTLTELNTTYNAQAEQFTWDASFSATNGVLPTSAWLVITPGPNPKYHVDEFAILYFDHVEEKLTTYLYNGQNSRNSFLNADGYLGTHDLSVTNNQNGTSTISADLMTSSINSALSNSEWVGVAFGEEIGLWYHPAYGDGTASDFTYGADGRILGYDIIRAGWYDTGNIATTTSAPVPEPSAALLFGIGGAVASSMTRRTRKA